MSLAVKGAVAIWHDIAPEGRDVFSAWHGAEHVPERVGIPGFLPGRSTALSDFTLRPLLGRKRSNLVIATYCSRTPIPIEASTKLFA